MDEWRFDGRTAIVTGAGGNPSLGRAHARLLAARGARVVVNDIGRDLETPGYSDSASAQAVARGICAAGGQAVADSHSVASEEGAAALVRTALEAFGGIDILINNAALFDAAPTVEISRASYEKLYAVNVFGTLFTLQAAARSMIKRGKGGKIINMASQAGRRGEPLVAVYCSTKAAVI